MPYTSDKLSIKNELLDRRVKLTQTDKKEVKRLYFEEHLAIREITRRYKVSRRLIQFILFPERIKKSRENRDWRDYYTKEKNREYQKKHRRYKNQLYKQGLLIKPKKEVSTV
jgi:predicted DNA-binding protein YlxM (UPF0122 family)